MKARSSIPRRIRSVGAGFVAAYVLSGCGMSYLEKNAPGIADIRTPPPADAPRIVEVPRNPGGNLVIVSYGGFAGIGGSGGPGGGSFSYGVGPEVSIAKGITTSNHPDSLFYPFMEWGYGVNLGWSVLSQLGKSVGPVYAEAEIRREAFALGLGWVWSPVDKTHGPQATLSWGPLYLRGTHEADLGTQVHLGLLIKGYSAWSWSR